MQMEDKTLMQERLNRREFLRTSALAAAATAVVACGANKSTSSSKSGTPVAKTTAAATQPVSQPTSAAPPTGQTPAATTSPSGKQSGIQTVATPKTYSGKYKEAPMLADLVRQGKLPPVEQRLPENPYVVPHDWLTQGKHGGTMSWVCSDTSDWSTTHLVRESMYGYAPLRFLKDGLELGPGLIESWKPNKPDLSSWTFNFRKGLKWSDGTPVSTDDVLFWWEDEVMYPPMAQTPPDYCRAGNGSLANFKKVDDHTLEVSFDAPAPLLPDFMASWVGNGISPARWLEPKHYLKQFHLKYNKKLNKKKWVDTYFAKVDFATNPDCPTLTGWMLQKYKKGQYSTWVRNPYYYAIDPWGSQLPFIDSITQTNIQDPQVMRLNIQQGKANYVHGAFVGLTLADVATIKSSHARNKLNILYWDSGSGTGSIFFFNYDYYDPKYRKLFRNPKFRQALSHAFDRATARKTIYFNQGEATTGTMSPKSIEYHVGQGPQVYTQWRDSYIEYNPAKTKQMLDELGLKDVNGDGWREFPDGSKLAITLDYPSGTSNEHIQKNALLSKNWQAVGLNAKSNPMTPTSREDLWESGRSMSKTAWEASDGPNSLINATWLVPSEASRWAPLEGVYYTYRGTPKQNEEKNVNPWKRHPPRLAPEKGGPVEKLWKLYDKAKLDTTFMGRTKLVWDIMKVHIGYGPFFMGVVANYPQLELVHEDMRNVPTREQLPQHGYVNTWVFPCPGAYDPEAYYWVNPEEHS